MNKRFTIMPLIVLCSMIVCSTKLYSQKDTLHIYYSGLQTQLSDSNETKIGTWAKSLNGRHVELEIYGYYDNSDFKKYVTERLDNLFLVVNRKLRDYITLKFMGPVKGKKWQRTMADIVYTSANASAVPVTSTAAEPKASGTSAKKERVEKQENAGQKEEKKESPKKQETKIVKPLDDRYIYDSIYVNGVLKVTKKKKKN